MADFDNLLDDLEQETQPSLSIHERESISERALLQDDTYNGTNESGDNSEEENEEENVVPPALQEALNQVIDQNAGEHSQQQSREILDLYGESEQEAHATAEYDALKKLWIQELNTTELCYYDEELIEYLIGLLNEKEDIPDNLRENGRSDTDPTLANIAASICNMDMERLRFILVDLFRVRLEKIEKYALHNRECTDRMSIREVRKELCLRLYLYSEPLLILIFNTDVVMHQVEYLKSYGELFQRHLERTVTDHFSKDAWKRLDEPDMIPRPDLDTYVFCKVIDEEGIVLNDFRGMDLSQDDEIAQHKQVGETLFIRYQTIREFVQQGKVELLM